MVGRDMGVQARGSMLSESYVSIENQPIIDQQFLAQYNFAS